MTDGYQLGVAPDQKNGVGITANPASTLFIPLDLAYFPGPKPDPLPFGEYELEPLPVLSIDPITKHGVYWLASGARFSADDVLSAGVRDAFVDHELRWVAPSEPITMVRRASVARAVAVSADGTEIVETLITTASGFAIRSGRQDDTPLAQLSLVGPTARSGFGAAYSRLADAVFVVGGRLANGTPALDVRTEHAGAWSSVALVTERPPVDVEAATYAWADGRLWLVDREPTSKSSRRFLYRVSPWTGQVETLRELHFLKQFDRVWLRTVDDGRVLLAATTANVHFAALLESAPFAGGKVSLQGFDFGVGELLKAPEIRYGRITRAVLRKLAGKPEVIVEHLGTVDTLKGGACGLSADL